MRILTLLCFAYLIAAPLAGSGQVIVNVITGETCINAPNVVEQTKAQIAKWNKKAGENMRLQIWTLPEATPLETSQIKLNGKPLPKGQKVPEMIIGYGSPTVLINGKNVIDSEWRKNGFATCAATVPSKREIRKLFKKVLRNRLK